MNYKLICCAVAVGLFSTSCFDDSYDLSNVDTTSRVTVNDLVIPINFDDVYLSDVIKIDEDSQIKEVEIDGKTFYAVSETGDFKSDPISIAQPHADKPTLNDYSTTLFLAFDGFEGGDFPLPELKNDFTFNCNDVDAAIAKITGAAFKNLTFSIIFTIAPATSNAHYSQVHIQLPKRMKGKASTGTYDPATGIWTIDNLTMVNGVTSISYTCESVEFDPSEFKFNSPSFEFSSTFSVLNGMVIVDDVNIPDYIDFNANFELSDLDVTAISGKIHYEIDGMNINPVDLTDIPDFLNGDQTNIALVNPMICLQTTNPVASDKLGFSAALTLIANRDNAPSETFSSSVFTIGYNDVPQGKYNTILSPVKPSADLVPETFRTDFNWFEYANLGSLLAVPENSSAKGLPSTIDIRIDKPQIYEQDITDFELGRELPGVTGSYELFAPLSLEKGSIIVYKDTLDGWNKDVENLTINKITVDTDATNGTPLEAQVTIYPLDVDGNRIPNVKFTSTTLQAMDTAHVSFVLDGTVSDFDGIEIIATIVSQSTETLSPNQSIALKNIRVMVDGFYEKEF